MLFQPTNIIPDVRTGIGLGVVDISQGLTVSWQVNGDYPVLTGYKIEIYQNDAASTLIQTIGPVVLYPNSFNGTDALGNPQVFNATISAETLSSSLTNGNEYKFIITQYYYANQNPLGGIIRQSSASVFLTRANPTLVVAPIGTSNVISSFDYTFNLTYAQSNGDVLEFIRYYLWEITGASERLIYDSGNIYCPTVLTCHYDGFMSTDFLAHVSYRFMATGQTSSGMTVSTTEQNFTAAYSVSRTGIIPVNIDPTKNAVRIDFSDIAWLMEPTETIIYRSGGQSGSSLVKVTSGITSETIFAYDYCACSTRGPYTYYFFDYSEDTGWNVQTGLASVISPTFAGWTLLVCTEKPDGGFTVDQEYRFINNVDSGNVSNNNAPYVANNFTSTPTVQISPWNYRSGSLTALIGTTNLGKYSDTYTQREALLSLSISQSPMFIKSSKGDLMQVRINGPITFSIQEGTPSFAQTVTVPWVEIRDASMDSIAVIQNVEY